MLMGKDMDLSEVNHVKHHMDERGEIVARRYFAMMRGTSKSPIYGKQFPKTVLETRNDAQRYPCCGFAAALLRYPPRRLGRE